MDEIGIMIFVDSNHGYNKVTGKSITGLISLIGSILVNWFIKRQSSSLTSTFGVEFTSLKRAAEKALVLRYYCRAFDTKVTKPAILYEDNMLVVINSTNPSSTL